MGDGGSLCVCSTSALLCRLLAIAYVPRASGTGLDAESDEIVARSSFLAMADSVVVVIVPTDVAGSALLTMAGAADFCVSSVELAIGVEPMNDEWFVLCVWFFLSVPRSVRAIQRGFWRIDAHLT